MYCRGSKELAAVAGTYPGVLDSRRGSSWSPAFSRIGITPEAPAESARAFSDVTAGGVAGGTPKHGWTRYVHR
jgi:hypothetical protein